MKLAPSTIAAAAAAAAAVALVHVDPWDERGPGGFVSTQSAAVRVFAELAEFVPAEIEITIAPTGGPAAVIGPAPDGGFQLKVDGVLWGPADPDAVEGLWASLRMATTLRGVPADAAATAVTAGRITIAFGGRRETLVIGGGTPDGVGVYGTLMREADSQTWVVERELGALLDQRPEAWLAARIAVVTPAEVEAVTFADGSRLERGTDGRFRSHVGTTSALLSLEAVEGRLDRLAAARLDPLLPSESEPATGPWLGLELGGERTLEIRVGGACPGYSDRRVVSRGSGRAGCVDAWAVAAWPLPGSGVAGALGWVEPRLLPYDYGSVLQIEQSRPHAYTLRRHGGDWVVQDDRRSTDVPAAEVFDWYAAVAAAEVEALDRGVPPGEWAAVQWTITTDSTATLRLACGKVKGTGLCRRDDGPMLAMKDASPLGFDPASFLPRQLVDLKVEDVRALEIVPGPASDSVRQSVHFDLGVWHLDAPQHPDGDGALAEVLLEELLGAFAGARATRWVAMPTQPPVRSVIVQRSPARGRETELVLRLYPACVVVVGTVAAELGDGPCKRLGTDLLHDDPLRFWIETARTLELTANGRTQRLRRAGELWLAAAGEPPSPSVRDRVAELSALRSVGLRSGELPGPITTRLRFLPAKGPAFTVSVAHDAAQIEGATWFYALSGPARGEP